MHRSFLWARNWRPSPPRAPHWVAEHEVVLIVEREQRAGRSSTVATGRPAVVSVVRLPVSVALIADTRSPRGDSTRRSCGASRCRA